MIVDVSRCGDKSDFNGTPDRICVKHENGQLGFLVVPASGVQPFRQFKRRKVSGHKWRLSPIEQSGRDPLVLSQRKSWYDSKVREGSVPIIFLPLYRSVKDRLVFVKCSVIDGRRDAELICLLQKQVHRAQFRVHVNAEILVEISLSAGRIWRLRSKRRKSVPWTMDRWHELPCSTALTTKDVPLPHGVNYVP